MTGFVLAPRYASGPGAIELLGELGGARPAVVTSARLATHPRRLRVIEEIQKAGGRPIELVAPDGAPDEAGAERLAEGFRSASPDRIIVVGGGRTIDIARAAWLRYERPDLPLDGISPLVDLRLRAKATCIVLPSTSGSGAEASGTLHLTSASGASLRPSSRELVPDWVLLDPYLPGTVAPPARADAAAIALGHALESMVSTWSQPFVEALGRRALAVLLATLPAVDKDPSELERVELVQQAAALAGLAAGNAQDGAAAALADALGPTWGLSYGRRLGIVLPYVLEFNYPSARDLYQSLAPEAGERIQHRSDLAKRVRTVLTGLGIPPTLGRAGLPEDRFRTALPDIVERAGKATPALANPRIPSPGEWSALLEAAYRGDPVSA